jgi:Holliday junction DNA helicase RuvA
MISYVSGKLEYRGNDFVIVERNGIGFNIQVSNGVMERMPSLGKEIKLYTYMNVKEDEISLFGFTSMDELNIFNKLIKVSGVGPKSAAALLGTFSPRQLLIAIAAEDDKLISTGPGIGKKTAQKIILELKDKVSTEDIVGGVEVKSAPKTENTNMADAVAALEALGFSRSEVFAAIGDTDTENMQTNAIVSAALRKLNKM